ncbi:hypothetical protein OIU84_014372 [Salix udensis]|uniref:Uncharacterized protein n=1 Tax=Salix udensis TaxID=889485 RepID=A0AAD6NRG9_9ROSI|nr:hypothetical protein OIU84_014372 [Salix udensis]
MHKSNEIRRVCKWIYSYFIGIVKFFVKMLFYANRAIQSIKPEFWEKNYESRRSLCRKLDVELPAQHSSIPYLLTNVQTNQKSVTPLVSSIISKDGGEDSESSHKFLINTILQRKVIDLKRAHNFGIDSSSDLVQEHMKTTAVDELFLQGTF